MNEVNETSPASVTSDVERLVMRFEKLRKELFDAIDYNIKMDGHHKSYEGRLSWICPHRFTDEYQIDLACYVIGPSRGHTWTVKNFAECLDQAECDIRLWIQQDRDSWKDV